MSLIERIIDDTLAPIEGTDFDVLFLATTSLAHQLETACAWLGAKSGMSADEAYEGYVKGCTSETVAR